MSEDSVSLREYVEQRFTDNAKLYDERELASQRALIEARESLGHRLDQMNEFRNQLREQASTFITRIEYDTLEEKLALLQSIVDKGEGRRTVTSAVVATFASIIVGLIVYFLQRGKVP